ncbi:TonB-dependent receptor domain-containing protein [Sphingopyxis sp. MWB1]|uniref:TonB-dependent receptor domain-containing protein n=1 Tax=Sphingopyxis sp. MWB1 TaxID=1537715 RepID=UPI00051A38F2|nr:TonB-dependent receptor [Sphingopyxis sp. MWB1]
MKNRTTLLAQLLGGTAALWVAASPALAQEAVDASDLDGGANAASSDEIVVTGSLFRRTNAETPSPVTVLSATAMQERGLNSAAEALQRVSAGNAGTITQGWNAGHNFAAGANAVSLRGLTVQSTLSIFDGLRMASYPLADDGQRNFVDLNTIPNAIIERIEILRDGASSTYGADAVAGVINVITKKEIQGLHGHVSAGLSQRGDAGERQAELTYGYGSLSDQGFNFYISGEYQYQDALWARDRGYPFNTADWSRYCKGDSVNCLRNLNPNGVSPNGYFNGLRAIPGITMVRPVDDAGGAIGNGRFAFLNAARGCGPWDMVQLTPDQIAKAVTAPADGRVCTQNAVGEYAMLQPEIERFGFSGRFTANIGDDHQLYAMGNYYKTRTFASSAPRGWTDRPTSPRSGAVVYNVIAPVYVCPTGKGTLNGVDTGCTAANGVLNPYNPYAASGRTAQLFFAPDRPTTDETSTRSLRGAIGLTGSFGDDWRYSAEFTASNVALTRTQNGYAIPQRIMDVVARGTFNFANPDATPDDVWDYIMPTNVTHSVSNLWQATANVTRSFAELPGGPLEAALGVAYRQESIDAPSANPQNDAHPYDRYYVINAVGTAGSRNVFSTFGEISAPVFDQLEMNFSGRYDSYSTGQSNFSPKVGVKVTPIPQIALRGTWSKGFRIPSFNEAFGLPTTGFVSQGGGTFCTTYAEFCAAHGNNAYASSPFSVGLTSVGNPELSPERSQNITLGAIFEPLPNVSFTVDLWRIKVRDQIVGVSDIGPVLAAYYKNNGVVNIPGIIVTPGAPDQANPNALPHIGTIQASYANANRQLVQGIDFGVNARFDLTDDVRFTTSFEASYLDKNHLTLVDPVTGKAQDPQKYEGTLSPCNVTSCSGSPQWRGSWQNTLAFGGTTISATAYYTSGYDVAQVDFDAVPGDCESAVDAGAIAYPDGTPFACRSKSIWNVDLTATQKIGDRFTIYANILNLLDTKPPFDPNAAYHLYGYNPAWAGPNIMGRYFRIGAKVSL